MNNLIKKYLKIVKSSDGNSDLKIILNEDLKNSAKSKTLGRYLYETYGLVEFVFAEIDYMQFKFAFNCITEEFTLKRYPSSYGQRKPISVGPYERDENKKKAYENLMKKSLSFHGNKDGWVFENIGYIFDSAKRKEILDKSKPEKINVVNEVNPVKKEQPLDPANQASRTSVEESGNKENQIVVKEQSDDTQKSFVIFGDSQINGNRKRVRKRFGGYREGVGSTRASYWLEQIKSGAVSERLNAKPSDVIILLGGNGTQKIKELLDEVHLNNS